MQGTLSMSETSADPVAAELDDIRKRWDVFGEADGLPRLLATVDAVLTLIDAWASTTADLRRLLAADPSANSPTKAARAANISTRDQVVKELREAITRELLGEGVAP